MKNRATRKNEAAEEQSGGLVPMTVRFSAEAMQVIGELAKEYGCGKAEIVRLAVDDRLVKFFGLVRYADEGQVEKMRRELAGVFSEIEKVRMELNRIGVNYNQQIKLEHLKRKQRASLRSPDIFGAITKEIEDAEKGKNVLNKDELDGLMRRYEEATGKAGEILCILR